MKSVSEVCKSFTKQLESIQTEAMRLAQHEDAQAKSLRAEAAKATNRADVFIAEANSAHAAIKNIQKLFGSTK